MFQVLNNSSLYTLALLLVAFSLAGCNTGETKVSIENAGTTPLDSVVVHVTGNRYMIGKIAPGERNTVYVTVSGESHVELELADGKRLVLDSYLEPGSGGKVEAVVTADSVLAVDWQHGLNL